MKKDKVLIIDPNGPTLEEAVKAINAKLPAGSSQVEIMVDEVTIEEKQALFENMDSISRGREQ